MNKIPPSKSGPFREFERLVSRPSFFVRHSAAKRIRYDLHSHQALTVTTVLEGEMTIQVDQCEHPLVAGQAALTNIDQQHSGWGNNVRYVTVRLVPLFVLEILHQTNPEVPGNDIRFLSSVTDDAEVQALAGSIATELATEKLGQAAMLEAMVRQMVIHLLRGHMAVRRSAVIELSRVGPVDRRLRRAIEFMHDNYSRELSLEEIAAAAYLSEYHFARLFKQVAGSSPHVYLANLRLERARALLLETSLPIGEIGAMVGYQSQSHFTKVFKSIAGVTPKVYRDGAGQIVEN